MTLAKVKAAAEKCGLSWRGAFHPEANDMPKGETVGTLVMLGFTGSDNWEVFASSSEYNDQEPHPLDRWSYRVISDLARMHNAKSYFPFTAPLMPFIRWAQKAEPVHPSAIGMMIHPDYGLWHAWRGALAFHEKLDLQPADERPSPCDSCVEKPCLSTCPVNAFDADGSYDVVRCADHLRTTAGKDCLLEGCRARRACPVAKEHQYPRQQMEFHMRAFIFPE